MCAGVALKKKCSALESSSRLTEIATLVTLLCFLAQTSVVAAHGQRQHLLQRQTLAQCRYDIDCMENAYCWNQQLCYCKDDYVVYRNRTNVFCLKVANNINDSCIADVQCHVTFTPNSECRNNICQCSSTAHFVNKRCYESVGLGKICQTTHNCYIKNTFCIQGYCVCHPSQHSDPEKTKCINNAYLNDMCTSDEECVAENTRCVEVCKCKVDYVYSNDGPRCLKAANSVGDSCQENSQCQEFLQNAFCDNGVCACMPTFHRRGSICVEDVGLGQRCASHNQCITQTYRDSNNVEVMNVDCLDGICTCAKNYIMSEELGDCIRYSENGATNWQAYGILSLVVIVNVSLWILQKTTES